MVTAYHTHGLGFNSSQSLKWQERELIFISIDTTMPVGQNSFSKDQSKNRGHDLFRTILSYYNVSPFPRDVEVRRSDVAMNPFIFLLKNNGQSILFISILGFH